MNLTSLILSLFQLALSLKYCSRQDYVRSMFSQCTVLITHSNVTTEPQIIPPCYFIKCFCYPVHLIMLFYYNKILMKFHLCWFEPLLRNFYNKEVFLIRSMTIANKVQMIGINSRHTDMSQVVLYVHELRYVLQMILSLLFLQFILRKEHNHRLVHYWAKASIWVLSMITLKMQFGSKTVGF